MTDTVDRFKELVTALQSCGSLSKDVSDILPTVEKGIEQNADDIKQLKEENQRLRDQLHESDQRLQNMEKRLQGSKEDNQRLQQRLLEMEDAVTELKADRLKMEDTVTELKADRLEMNESKRRYQLEYERLEFLTANVQAERKLYKESMESLLNISKNVYDGLTKVSSAVVSRLRISDETNRRLHVEEGENRAGRHLTDETLKRLVKVLVPALLSKPSIWSSILSWIKDFLYLVAFIIGIIGVALGFYDESKVAGAWLSLWSNFVGPRLFASFTVLFSVGRLLPSSQLDRLFSSFSWLQPRPAQFLPATADADMLLRSFHTRELRVQAMENMLPTESPKEAESFGLRRRPAAADGGRVGPSNLSDPARDIRERRPEFAVAQHGISNEDDAGAGFAHRQ